MSSLTPVQQQVLILLAEGSTVSAAAQKVGIHRNTVANWRRSSSYFRDTWASVQYEQAMHWRDEIQSLGGVAVETLRSVLTNEKASPSLRLRAALAVLDKISKPAPAQPEFASERDQPMSSEEAHATLLGRRTNPEAVLNPGPAACAQSAPAQAAQVCTTAQSPQQSTNSKAVNHLGEKAASATAAQPCTTAQLCTSKSGLTPLTPRESCPCGSGIHYSRCCLPHSQHARAAA